MPRVTKKSPVTPATKSKSLLSAKKTQEELESSSKYEESTNSSSSSEEKTNLWINQKKITPKTKVPKKSPVTPATKSKSLSAKNLKEESESSSENEESIGSSSSSEEQTNLWINQKKMTPKTKGHKKSPVTPVTKSKSLSAKNLKEKSESSSENEESMGSSSSSEEQTNLWINQKKMTPKTKVPKKSPVTPATKSKSLSAQNLEEEPESSSGYGNNISSSSSSDGTMNLSINQKKMTPKTKSTILTTPMRPSTKSKSLVIAQQVQQPDSLSEYDSNNSASSSSEEETNILTTPKKEAPRGVMSKIIPVRDSEDTPSEDECSNPIKQEPEDINITSEDDNNMSESVKTDKQKAKSKSHPIFENTLKGDFSLQPVKLCSSLLTAEELSSLDYEIWTVSTPNQMDARKLQDLELSLSKSTKFNADNVAYRTIVHRSSAHLDFILPDKASKFQFISREVVGNISIVNDVIPITNEKSSTGFCNKLPIELPQGLKRRHPIYGDSNQLEKLQKLWSKSSSAEEHKKKGIKREIEEVAPEEEPKKKKRKMGKKLSF